MEHTNLCPLCVEPRWHGCQHPSCPVTQGSRPLAPTAGDFVPTEPSLARKGDARPTAARVNGAVPDLQSLDLRTSADRLGDNRGES